VNGGPFLPTRRRRIRDSRRPRPYAGRVDETPSPAVEEPSVSNEGTAASPYKNLFVPLVVVPAAIVGAIVLVCVFFGAISGREATLAENLDRVVNGGQNDRKQAAFNMVRQIAENRQASTEGRDLPWPLESDFPSKLRRAWEGSSPSEPEIRLVLASLLAQIDDPEGVPNLVALLDTSEKDDPGGAIRFNALASLGALGDARGEAAAIRVLQSGADPGLRAVAAVALQRIPGEAGLAALRAAVEDPVFEVRANAALALATRGDPAGSSVLRALLEPGAYDEERGRDAAKFTEARRISESRVAAIAALARLRRPEDRAALAALADLESDLAVREAAMKALEDWK
jgi:HEAT repeat protein